MQTPTLTDLLGYDQQVGGTLCTGMHSCFSMSLCYVRYKYKASFFYLFLFCLLFATLTLLLIFHLQDEPWL